MSKNILATSSGQVPLRLLEAIREQKKQIKFYQAGSSEMYGLVQKPQKESTPFYPKPYAAIKFMLIGCQCELSLRLMVFISNGILFNHESPRRGETFVLEKSPKP